MSSTNFRSILVAGGISQLTQLLAQEPTTVLRVAPADMAVHTRVHRDLTGTLPGIPVGIAGGKETLRYLSYTTGERL